MVDRIAKWLHRLFEDYKLVRRSQVFWSMALITALAMKLYWINPEPPTADEIKGFIAIVGLLQISNALYMWKR